MQGSFHRACRVAVVPLVVEEFGQLKQVLFLVIDQKNLLTRGRVLHVRLLDIWPGEALTALRLGIKEPPGSR
ncbi:hypothetical protein D3C79_950720 [compost metagenome]